MPSEQFSLCWDNFHKNMSTEMNQLLENEDLVDVTLAIEGRYLKAHKMVLSVCSPYFKELFRVNPCQHPIVFMKDVSYVVMNNLLQFMYQGEVQVSQENLTTFIKTAESLQIKGLTGDGNGTAESETDQLIEETPPKTVIIQQAATSRPKKIRQITPPPKRQRLSAPAIVTKQDSHTTEEIIQFKLEPYEQNQAIVTAVDQDDFTDDALDNSTNDDVGEEYTVIEGSEEEPQAGTSTDVNSVEGQDDDDDDKPVNRKSSSYYKMRTNRRSYIADGYIYHNNIVAGRSKLRYLSCGYAKRTACKARATVPVDGTSDQLKVTQAHNHPPDLFAAEKDLFLRELKKTVTDISNEKMTLKMVYEALAPQYPNAAAEITFKSIGSSLHRWRKAPK